MARVVGAFERVQRTDDGRDDLFLTCEIRTVDGQSLGVLVLKEKVFRSSKTGFFGQAKLEVEDQRYQAQAQLVAIASKSKGDGVPPGISAALDVLRGRVSREALRDPEPGEESF